MTTASAYISAPSQFNCAEYSSDSDQVLIKSVSDEVSQWINIINQNPSRDQLIQASNILESLQVQLSSGGFSPIAGQASKVLDQFRSTLENGYKTYREKAINSIESTAAVPKANALEAAKKKALKKGRNPDHVQISDPNEADCKKLLIALDSLLRKPATDEICDQLDEIASDLASIKPESLVLQSQINRQIQRKEGYVKSFKYQRLYQKCERILAEPITQKNVDRMGQLVKKMGELAPEWDDETDQLILRINYKSNFANLQTSIQVSDQILNSPVTEEGNRNLLELLNEFNDLIELLPDQQVAILRQIEKINRYIDQAAYLALAAESNAILNSGVSGAKRLRIEQLFMKLLDLKDRIPKAAEQVEMISLALSQLQSTSSN